MDKREKGQDEHPGQDRVSRFVEFFERVSSSQTAPHEVKRKSDKKRRRTGEMSDGNSSSSDGLVVAERKRSGKRKHRKLHKKQKKAKKHKRHKHHRTDDESEASQRKTFDSEDSEEEEDKDEKEEEEAAAAGGVLVGGRGSSAKDLEQQQQYRARYESPKRGGGRERSLKDDREAASQLRGCGEADYTDLHKSSEYDGSKSRFQGHGSQRRAYDERLATRDEPRRQPPSDRQYSGPTRYSALSRYSGERSRKPSEARGGRETKGGSDQQRRRSTPSSHRSPADERRFDAASYYRWQDEAGRHPYHSRRTEHRRSRSGPRDERDERVQRGADHRREHGYSPERSGRGRPAKDERFARQAASRWDSPGGKEYREQRHSPDYDGSNRYYGSHKMEARMSGRKRFGADRGPTRDEYRHKSPEFSHSAPSSSADIPRRSANGDYRQRYSGERSSSGIRKQREPPEATVLRTENGRPRHRSPLAQHDERRSDRNETGYEYRRNYEPSQQLRGDRPNSPYRSSRTQQQRRSLSGSRSKRDERGSQHETDHRRTVTNRSGVHSTAHATDRRLERLPHSPGERSQRKGSRSPPRSSLHDGRVKTEGHAMVKIEKQSGSSGHEELKKEPTVGEQEQQSKAGKLAVDRKEKNQQQQHQRFGRNGDSEGEDGEPPVVEKQKPNFALSGKLTEETNKVNGVVIMYAEPPGARKPKRRWRLYPFKGDQALPTLYIHRQSCYLIGRDRKICDLPIDHPSCSKQHAVIQYRLVANEREDGSTGKCVRPYIIDLESANGTFVNYKKIEPKRYLQLFEKDVLKFGFSSREYVLLDENSKEQQQEDEEDDERLDEIT